MDAKEINQAQDINVNQAPISWHDFYNQRGEADNPGHWIEADPDHWFAKLGNFFTGIMDKYKSEYDSYLSEYNRMKDFELAKIADEQAREFDKRMSDSAFQRAYNDLVKTGLNPRLLLTQNFSASSPTAGNGFFSASSSSSRSSSQSESNTYSNSFSRSAVIVALMATILKMIL